MSIPKIIHYCWFGGKPIPDRDRSCIESWKKYCPDYKIIEWNEQNYDVTKNPYMREAYQSGRWGFVPDYARMDIVYRYGGIYLDTDVELIRSLDDFLEVGGFAGIEKVTLNLALGLGFGAIKGHPLLKELCDVYETMHFLGSDGKPNLTPNPQIMTKYINEKYPGVISNQKAEIQNGFIIFPTEYFCPQNYETGITEITDKTYSIHHYHASWQTPEEKAKISEYKKYTNVFGEEIGNLIYQTVSAFRKGGIIQMMRKIKGHLKKKQ